MEYINNPTLKIENMKTYNLTEQQLFDLLRNSFVAGEFFAEDIQAFEWEEVVEVTEPDFEEYFEQLDLKEFENK